MKILIAGDYCPGNRVADLIEYGDFEQVFGEVKPIIESADYSIVNFETCIASESDNPISKIGPNLKCTNKAVDAIKWAGFKCLTLANNHFRDYGDVGVVNSLKKIDLSGLDKVGGGMNLEEASSILYRIIEGRTLAIINACEHEFSIATDNQAGSNPLNPIRQYYGIEEARKKADFVIAIIHGGHEHCQLPSPLMQETYRFFIDAGADAVVNHHQHCYSGYEFYNGKPIFYGLGNFCFDEGKGNPDFWYEGLMLNLELGEEIKIDLVPYVQCKDNPAVSLMQGEEKEQFFARIEKLNTIIANPKELQKHHDEWMDKNDGGVRLLFTPYQNRWLNAAFTRHLLPSFFSCGKRLFFIDSIDCESHRERVLRWLKSK